MNLYRIFLRVWYRNLLGMRNLGKNVSFGFRIIIDGPSAVTIGDNVILRDDIWLHIQGEKNKNKITIGKNCHFEKGCCISAADSVSIGKNVIFGPNVFVSDHLHNYEDISIPIIKQGITKILPVSIGEGSWLGINSVILPGVKIGKNCVIGANSVVNKTIPDYCVAGGIPAKVIKQYNFKKKKWVKNRTKVSPGL